MPSPDAASAAEVAELAEQIKKLTTAAKLRLAVGLLDAGNVRLAMPIVEMAYVELQAAWRAR